MGHRKDVAGTVLLLVIVVSPEDLENLPEEEVDQGGAEGKFCRS